MSNREVGVGGGGGHFTCKTFFYYLNLHHTEHTDNNGKIYTYT